MNDINKCKNCPYILYDKLTGLLRREAFIEKYENLKKNSEENYYFCIADIDLFKKFNDNYGHLTGDFVLKEFSKKAVEMLQQNEFAGRFGGEEFVFILKGDKERVEIFFNTLIFSGKNKEFNGKKIPDITFSMGAVSADGESFESCISKSDEALYYSKKYGRKQLNFYENILLKKHSYRKTGLDILKTDEEYNNKEKKFWLIILSYKNIESEYYEKGVFHVKSKLNNLFDQVKELVDVHEHYIYKNKALCIIITDITEYELNKKLTPIIENHSDFYGVINGYPGITKFNHLFNDTFLSFNAHEIFKRNQGIVFYNLKSLRATGYNFFIKKNITQAYNFFRRCYFLDKNSAIEIINLTSAMLKKSKSSSAYILLERNKNLLEKYEEYYISTALYFYKTGFFDKTEEIIMEGLKKFPESSLLNRNLKEIRCLTQK